MKKLSILLALLLLLTLTLIGCGGEGGESKEGIYVELTQDKSEAAVGEKIKVTVMLSCDKEVKSYGLELKYDKDLFELVDNRILDSGAIADFSDDILVVAYDNPTTIYKNVFTFTLKAKATCSNEEISVYASLKDKNDSTIAIDNYYDSSVTIYE